MTEQNTLRPKRKKSGSEVPTGIKSSIKERFRLLWLSDGPTCAIGLAPVTRHVLERLLAAGVLTPEATFAPDLMKLMAPGSPATPGVRNAALPPWQRAICAALPLARGRYLLYVEQGVALTPQHVQSCVNILSCQGDCVVCWGQALPIGQLLLHDALTPFSRFHLTSERIRQLVRRAGGVERKPVRSLQGGEPSAPDHLFLSREIAQRVTSQDSGAAPLPGSVTLPALIHAGARPVCLERLQAYRAFSERRRAS